MRKLEYDLEARYDARKDFYGKANVIETIDDNNKVVKLELRSYNTIVAEITYNSDNTPIIHYFGSYSQTTTRHQKEFIKQFTNENPKTKKDLEKWLADDYVA